MERGNAKIQEIIQHMIKNKEVEERPPICDCWQEREEHPAAATPSTATA